MLRRSTTAVVAERTDMAETDTTNDAPLASGAVTDVLSALIEYLDDLSERIDARLGSTAGVAVTMDLDGAPFTVGASTELARAVDELQYRIGVGPCLLALTEGVGLYVPDLGADDRWGEYGPQAARMGAASCVSVPVLLHGRPSAVLKVYHPEVDGISPEDRSTAAAAAPEIAGGLGLARLLTRQAQNLDDRTSAMDNRRVIDLALGVLMNQRGGGPDAAFTALRRMSQESNRKLRDVAVEVLESVADGAPVAGAAPFHERDSPPLL